MPTTISGSQSQSQVAETVARRKGQACGQFGILTLMHMARRLDWQPTLLAYANSDDTYGYGC